LTVTAGSDRTAAKRATYAESQKAARRGLWEPVRDTLRRSVRTAVASASGLEEFFERLREDGVLVRERFSERNPGAAGRGAAGVLDARGRSPRLPPPAGESAFGGRRT
jgi:uroporphyrinogen-III synthase